MAFIIKLLMILILVNHYNNAIKIMMSSKNDVGLCTDSARLFWNFTWHYLKDSYGARITDIEGSSKDLCSDIMRCSMQNIQLPVKFRENMWNYKKEEIFHQNNSEGLILVTKSSEKLKILMNTGTKINNNAKAIIIFRNSTKEDVEEVLKLAWDRYKVLNIVIFRTINIGEQETTYLLAYVYNPFVITNDMRGHINTFKIEADGRSTRRLLENLDNRLINVHQYPLKICIFEFLGGVAPSEYKNGVATRYSFPDGDIIHELTKAINFYPVYFNPRDGPTFGQILPNGSATGDLKELQTGQADILANIRLFRDLGTSDYEFLFSIDETVFAFMTPKINSRHGVSFVEIFSATVSIALAGSYAIMVITRTFLQRLHLRLRNDHGRTLDFIKICCMTFGEFLLMSQPGPTQNYERCLFIGWIFFSMISCFSYQATMVQYLTTSVLSGDIQSLEELAESDLKILFNAGLKDIMMEIVKNEGESGIFTRLLQRSEFFKNPSKALKLVTESRDAAMMMTLLRCLMLQVNYYSNTIEGNMIHILEQGPPNRPSAHLVPLNSPYKDRFNKILMNIKESGLMPKWSDDVLYDLRAKSLRRSSEVMKNTYEMQELSFVFWSWLACCCFCFFVFLLELLLAYLKKKKVELKAKFRKSKRREDS